MPETQNPEQHYERLNRRASDVLFSPSEVETAVDAAIDDGQIKVEVIDEAQAGPGNWPISVKIPVERHEITDLNGNQLEVPAELANADEYVLGANQYRWKDETAGGIKEAEYLKAAVRSDVLWRQRPWYLDNRAIANLVESDCSISEMYRLGVGSKDLEVINFANTPMTDEQARKLAQTIETAVHSSGAQTLKSLSGIVIVPTEVMNDAARDIQSQGVVLGKYTTDGMIMINEQLLSGAFADDGGEKYGLDSGITALETTVAHELGHALQKGATMHYAQATGWTAYNDSGGSVSKNTLGQPAEIQQVYKDGKIVDVPLGQLLGDYPIEEVKPKTDYGEQADGEDFAEAYVPYALAGRQTENIDPVRLNAVATTATAQFDYGSREHGPFKVNVEKVDMSQLAKEKFAVDSTVVKVTMPSVSLKIEPAGG